jgi:enoyl-CoA hydratase
MTDFAHILVEDHGVVLVIKLNRPKALNALNREVAAEITTALKAYERDTTKHCAVLTGSEKAFAAGADIKEMQPRSYPDMFGDDYFGPDWAGVAHCRKPLIAAVAGYALGGGCELAMMCDFIIAADNAKFGQPEITLAVTPGMGGSQRLTKLVGKSKAMDMILTGRMMDAVEAERSGLASRIVPLDKLMEEALAAAQKIASMAPMASMLAKDMVNVALETPLQHGLQYERRLFHSLFATEDQKEGMTAFIEKRPGTYKGK